MRILSTLVLLIGVLIIESCSPTQNKLPNIVLIYADDTDWSKPVAGGPLALGFDTKEGELEFRQGPILAFPCS